MTSADRLRIYIDTSVLGGCFDAEFATWSNGLVRDFRAAPLIPVLSDVTADEVQDAPAPVRELHQEILTIVETVLPITEDALALVAAYEPERSAGKYQPDMLHIALATVARVDALVSWNFKHIVRLEKIRLFNEVNVQLGHQVLNILSPRNHHGPKAGVKTPRRPTQSETIDVSGCVSPPRDRGSNPRTGTNFSFEPRTCEALL